MLYPSIDKLLNIVDSKYMLVHVASKRSKQMLETSHYQMRINDYVRDCNDFSLDMYLDDRRKQLIDLKSILIGIIDYIQFLRNNMN